MSIEIDQLKILFSWSYFEDNELKLKTQRAQKINFVDLRKKVDKIFENVLKKSPNPINTPDSHLFIVSCIVWFLVAPMNDIQQSQSRHRHNQDRRNAHNSHHILDDSIFIRTVHIYAIVNSDYERRNGDQDKSNHSNQWC